MVVLEWERKVRCQNLDTGKQSVCETGNNDVIIEMMYTYLCLCTANISPWRTRLHDALCYKEREMVALRS